MKTVLITRPKNQSQEIVQLFENEGYKSFIEPLFSVTKIDVRKNFSPTKVSQISAIIITSSNACFSLIDCEFPKNIKIFTVGKMTAQKLAKAGFYNIISKNSAEELKNFIVENHQDKSKPILYFHGSVISLDFAQELKKSALKVEKILSYQTHEMENFSSEFLEFVGENSFEQILLFSQNSAKIFLKLAKQHNLLEYFAASQIVCLSEKILTHVKNDAAAKFKNLTTFDQFPILKKFYD